MSSLRKGAQQWGEEKKPKASSKEKTYSQNISICIVGERGSGRRSLLTRCFDNDYTDSMLSSLGVDFKSGLVDIDKDTTVKLTIYTEAFAKHQGMRNFTSYILIADSTDSNSLDNLRKQAKEITSRNPKPFCVLVATKWDRVMDRYYDEEMLNQFATDCGIEASIPVSAKTGENCELFIKNLAKSLYKPYVAPEYHKGDAKSVGDSKLAYDAKDTPLETLKKIILDEAFWKQFNSPKGIKQMRSEIQSGKYKNEEELFKVLEQKATSRQSKGGEHSIRYKISSKLGSPKNPRDPFVDSIYELLTAEGRNYSNFHTHPNYQSLVDTWREFQTKNLSYVSKRK